MDEKIFFFVLNVFNTAKKILKNDGRKNIFVLNVFNTAKKSKKIKNKQKMTDEK